MITLTLSRGGTSYATCALVLDQIETEMEHGVAVTEAEYKVRIRQKLQNGVLVTTQTGACTDGTGTAVLPAVQAGDVAKVSAGSSPSVDFLQGTFKTKK